MSLQIHLLACLAEEATEVSQEAVNCIREGACAVPTFESDVTYREALTLEYADMTAIMDLMKDNGYPLPIYNGEIKAEYEFEKNRLLHVLEGKNEDVACLMLIQALNIMGQTVSKCIRFTMDHYHPAYGKTNKEQVASCFARVIAIIDHIDAHYFKIPLKGEDIDDRIAGKKDRTLRLYEQVTRPLMEARA